ncbi:MAG: TIGR04283 family arsenosugar biosynthesis glycosyltransferase [Synechococcales bacterium]|nr:TIGR04283 family arsenosugar biosynthesis glycosyltransferase [Synechococcales bacterium]
MTDHLIIITRYPQVGATKTRLIPALGARGAAELQRQMAEHTLAQAQQLMAQRSASVEIRYSNGSPSQMAQWLGQQWQYCPQGEGDLGDRLIRAFTSAAQEGKQRILAIGIDCPELDTARLALALDTLEHHDLVLGPALDGGYYLIGLQRPIPDLFQGIDWGTDRVLAQTLAIAHRLGLTVAQLPPLADVDYPDDLPIWERVSGRSLPENTERISLIIPTLNEAARIQATLKGVQEASQAAWGVEVIVVDGGSSDATPELAKAMGARVIPTKPGRANQMNQGAAAAAGDILVFLHGDTLLPPKAITHIRQILVQPGTIAGAFELQIWGDQPGLRLVEWGVNWRSRRRQLPYGDQALFLGADTFRQLGGFPDLPILEDVILVRRLRQLGTVAIAPAAVSTSGRRWQKLGVVKTTVINQLILGGYFLGVSPQRLARWYGGDRPTAPPGTPPQAGFPEK